MIVKKSQTERIEEYLGKGHTLTPLSALRLFGCLRLGARIFDLRKKGLPIEGKMIKTISGKWVKLYSLSKGDAL